MHVGFASSLDEEFNVLPDIEKCGQMTESESEITACSDEGSSGGCVLVQQRRTKRKLLRHRRGKSAMKWGQRGRKMETLFLLQMKLYTL